MTQSTYVVSLSMTAMLSIYIVRALRFWHVIWIPSSVFTEQIGVERVSAGDQAICRGIAGLEPSKSDEVLDPSRELAVA